MGLQWTIFGDNAREVTVARKVAKTSWKLLQMKLLVPGDTMPFLLYSASYIGMEQKRNIVGSSSIVASIVSLTRTSTGKVRYTRLQRNENVFRSNQ
mmetsp:Transcript_19263/g.47634  ORF Transcript_19263/g.47634 Transcript_19263/m.47634 type:complete len:96 (+) Transcript_19263:1198-1485(+)